MNELVFLYSMLLVSYTVSSFQMAWSCVPSIMVVKIANRRASNPRNKRSITVAGGLYDEHSFHSEWMQEMN